MAVFTALGTAAATAIFGAAASGTLAFTAVAAATTAGLTLLAGLGLSAIAKSLAGQEQPAITGTQIDLRSGDGTPRSVGVGKFATAGSLAYYNTWGKANQYATQVIALSDMPGQTLGKIFVDGNEATLNATPHANRGYPVDEFTKDGVAHLWVKFYDGTQTTADAFLVADVASTERPYASSRVGYGISYAIVTARAPVRKDDGSPPLFKTGGLPRVKFELSVGTPLFDPSDVAQDGGDDSTWGGVGDHNPAVQLYNVLRGIRYDGEWLYGAQGISDAQLPADDWATKIDKAQAAISKPGGGTEPTYRSGGEILVSTQVSKTVESLLTAMQGRLVSRGGIYKLVLGAADAYVATISDTDIISTEEQTFAPFLSLADSITGISGTYPNPNSGWLDKVSPPIIDTDLEARVGNRRLMASTVLDMVPYKAQVQRLLKSALAEAQRERRHVWVLGPEFWGLEPGDVLRVNSVRNGYVNKLFRIDGYVDKANLDVMVQVVEVDPADYDWNPTTDYQAEFDGPITQIVPPALVMDDWVVTAETVNDDLGRPRVPTIRVAYDTDVPDVSHVHVYVRVAGETDPFFDLDIPYTAPYSTLLPGGPFKPAADYEAKGVFVRPSGQQADETTWDPVTTDDTRLIAEDIEDGAVGIAAFASTIAAPQIVALLASAITGEGNLAVLTTDGKLYRYHSGAWTPAVPTVDLTGQVTTAQIVNAAITNVKLGLLAVATGNIQTAAVTSAIIANNAVQTANIAALAVTASEVANATLTGAKIAAATIAAGNVITGTLTSTQIASGTITATNIATGTITATQVAAGTITATQIATDTITASQIAANAITASEISALAVTSGKINAGAVSTSELAAGAVTAVKITAGAITATEIATDTITAGQIAAGAIGASEIAADAVRAVHILAGEIKAGKLDVGSINTSSLMIDDVVIDAKILAGAVTDNLGWVITSGTYGFQNSLTTVNTGVTISSAIGSGYALPAGAYAEFTTTAAHSNWVFTFELSTNTGLVIDSFTTGTIGASTNVKVRLGGVIPPLGGSYNVRLRAMSNFNFPTDLHPITRFALAIGGVKK